MNLFGMTNNAIITEYNRFSIVRLVPHLIFEECLSPEIDNNIFVGNITTKNPTYFYNEKFYFLLSKYLKNEKFKLISILLFLSIVYKLSTNLF